MILCIKQSTLTHIKILGRIPGTNSFSALQESPEEAESSEHDYSNSLDLFQPSASNITNGEEGGRSGGGGAQEELPGILIIRLRDVSLHFANTSALKERLRRLEKYGAERSHPADEPRRSEASVVVFEMKDVVGIDPGAARVLEEVVKSYGDRDVLVSSLFSLSCRLDSYLTVLCDSDLLGSTANESVGNLEKSWNYRSFGRR